MKNYPWYYCPDNNDEQQCDAACHRGHKPFAQYVVSFMIQPEKGRVLLVKKNRPAFQVGKWNGIGGKIEPNGETALQAVVREFREETGVQTEPGTWEHTITLEGRSFVVHYYRSFVHDFPAYETVTDEEIMTWNIDDVFQTKIVSPGWPAEDYRVQVCRTLDNLRWILPIQTTIGVVFPLLVKWEDAH